MPDTRFGERSSRARSAILALLVAGLLGNTGCSFLFVSGPPDPMPQQPVYLSCTESNAWPIIDAIWAGLNGLGAAVAVSAEEGTGEGEIENRGQVIAVGLAWLAISGSASIYGFSKTGKCRHARRVQMQRMYQNQQGPTWGPPQPQPPPPGPPPPASYLVPPDDTRDGRGDSLLPMRSR